MLAPFFSVLICEPEFISKSCISSSECFSLPSITRILVSSADMANGIFSESKLSVFVIKPVVKSNKLNFFSPFITSHLEFVVWWTVLGNVYLSSPEAKSKTSTQFSQFTARNFLLNSTSAVAYLSVWQLDVTNLIKLPLRTSQLAIPIFPFLLYSTACAVMILLS